MDKWSQEKKDEFKKVTERINKAWGESKERERKERVANALGFEKDKSKINSEASTSKKKVNNEENNKAEEIQVSDEENLKKQLAEQKQKCIIL